MDDDSFKGPSHFTVAILPKPGLSSADHQRLAYRLTVALPELRATEDCQGGASAINDLITGEPPKPLLVRMTNLVSQMRRKVGERERRLETADIAAEFRRRHSDSPLATLLDVPAVYVNVSSNRGEGGEDVLRHLASLLPPELICEIRQLRC